MVVCYSSIWLFVSALLSRYCPPINIVPCTVTANYSRVRFCFFSFKTLTRRVDPDSSPLIYIYVSAKILFGNSVSSRVINAHAMPPPAAPHRTYVVRVSYVATDKIIHWNNILVATDKRVLCTSEIRLCVVNTA